jgi:hypothetical protein
MGEARQHRAAGDDRRVEAKLGCVGVAPFLKLDETPTFRVAGAAAHRAQDARLAFG